MDRRLFLKFLATGILVGCAPGEFTSSPIKTNVLRPPGAIPEDFFASRCIRCGRCAESCPYRSIKILDIKHGFYAGTPVIYAEKIPCYLCMRCVKVCPTGTLQKVSQKEVRMGLARVNRRLCVTWNGTGICRSCYNACPFKEQAIKLDRLRPIVVPEACVGCGLCTYSCPVKPKAIVIEPIYAFKASK
ncbi:4Fe-4S dicluster domain-containing protein [Thermosulfurimonas dismutans]|uniref:Periplasmic nitrate reductase, subunit NapG n=2 Tax=Thermosulfurimonas dismutans TaxID=999894 RepID=A0A179D6N0_9BACT|nr:4Fe-4S dicluster domain-containing protein [Thermosulfurimonas dismutans]OAQ21379.1 Periplasmic nitrate reductase, subunit NapG [Thermosulfurimonas dismutans]